MDIMRKRIITTITSAILIIMLFSSLMTVFAWSDFTQNKTNLFRGTVAKTTVVLHKYEMDADGNIISRPVRGAQFKLFMIYSDGTPDKKIGGTYTTDQSGKITIGKLSSGSYKFVETEPSYGYDYTLDDKGKPVHEYLFTVTADDALGYGIVEVDAYNLRLTSDLEVEKIVKGMGADLTKQFAFTIAFSDGETYPYKINGTGFLKTLDDGKFYLKHGEKAVFEGVPVGVYYQVIEMPDPEYFTQSVNNQGTIQLDTVSKAEFTNTYAGSDKGKLEIKKIVSGTDADTNGTFEFKVTFSVPGTYAYKINGIGNEISFTSGGTLQLKHNQTAVFEDLPVGMTYIVTETSANEDGYTASIENMSGKIIPATESGVGTVQALFENHKDEEEKKPGSLEIRKTVTGANASQTMQFDFTVTFSGDDAVDVPFAYTTNKGQSGTITNSGVISLIAGETAVFKDIPAGVTYKVVEDNYAPDGYTASMKEQSGTIPSGCRTYAAFNNHKESDSKETKITVEKIVKGEIPESEKTREFWFTFIKNDEKPVRFSLKAGEQKSFVLNAGDTYSITEDDPFQFSYIQTSAINGTGTAAEQELKVTITNIYIGTIWKTIQGKKTWKLNGAPDSVVPDSITVHLKNGKEIVETKTVTPDSDGKWSYEFIAPKYDKDGKEIHYTIEEDSVLGFETTVKDYNITNTYTGKTGVTVKKVWDDHNNPNRPKEIKVQLYKNGFVEGKQVTLNAANNWSYTWTGLDFRPTWTVDETKVPTGYTKTITGSAKTGFIITNVKPGNGKPEETNISGSKIWNHGDNPIEKHPSSIKVSVKNGKSIVAQAVVSAENHWSWNFRLLKYDQDGKIIQYTIDEDPVPGYIKTVSNYDLINTFDPGWDDPNGGKITISGEKIWKYGSAPEDDRPASVTVHVIKDDKIIAEKTVKASDGWKYSFELPKYEVDGKTLAHYRIDEGNVSHYTHQVDGYDLINTYQGVEYPGDNPKTGDTSNPWQWIIIMLISAVMLIRIITVGHKSKYKGRRYARHRGR